MSTSLLIPVILWLRVSDVHQNEDNQLPDLEKWCEAHGYRVVMIVRVHGKSAWKPGRLDKEKRQVLDAVRSGVASVVVAWSVDRWARGGIADLLDGMRAVKEAGGRVEFVQDAILNVPGDAQELLMAVLAWVANMESKRRSDRTRNGMERRRGEGAIMGGRVPLGYKLVQGDRVRDEAALGVVRETFERSARGESTAVIEAFIRRAGYRRRANTIAEILRNPAYVSDGIVSAALARAAVEGLESRRRGKVRRASGEDYSGMFRCPCGKVMHRVLAGGMPSKGVEATRYYRCREHEGKPVPMIRADHADALIDHVMAVDWLPWRIRSRTGGDTRDAETARLRKELEDAVRRGADRSVVNALYDEIDAVQARVPEPERVEWVDSGKTRGEHWAELTPVERRAWLDSEDTTVTAWNVKESVAGWTTDTEWALGRVRMKVVTEEEEYDAS